ncbi:unnamed protein product [Boreogadus saida]
MEVERSKGFVCKVFVCFLFPGGAHTDRDEQTYSCHQATIFGPIPAKAKCLPHLLDCSWTQKPVTLPPTPTPATVHTQDHSGPVHCTQALRVTPQYRFFTKTKAFNATWWMLCLTDKQKKQRDLKHV